MYMRLGSDRPALCGLTTRLPPPRPESSMATTRSVAGVPSAGQRLQCPLRVRARTCQRRRSGARMRPTTFPRAAPQEHRRHAAWSNSQDLWPS
jgi:hypothetical protein